MDGNGRWAKARRLPRIAGHKSGVEAVRKVVEAAPDLGVEVLTLYAFSSENWKRPEDEVGYLMGLLKQYLLSEIAELDRNGVRLSFIGDYSRLSPDILALLEGAKTRTAGNRKLRLVIALNYGSQDEITRAVRSIARDVAAGRMAPDDVTPADITARLDTAELPQLDLVIRTSGEQRLSNFLMWQAAYAELVFTEQYWPDFDGESLRRAVEAFGARERRYGGL
ncbi:isoprenyl transferase [Sphingosinicella sp.]|uniref:isoprenyl transferase n=1 Tax=Sphingosinicella sp. TaxID=1917971 RepID=UPI00181E2736|nr:isoprenyl transferase [Sphingosinicella sp.]MBA4757084.1 isoprenyl transferase [Sphingosinicella sp.]